jgi:hypothetical protein
MVTQRHAGLGRKPAQVITLELLRVLVPLANPLCAGSKQANMAKTHCKYMNVHAYHGP